MIEKISLFSTKREFFLFVSFCLFILSYSLLIEYNNYKNLTKFDSQIIEATVLKQYTKTKLTKNKETKSYQVLKLQAAQGFSFYTIPKNTFPPSIAKTITLELWAGEISFYEYMTSFFAFAYIFEQDDSNSLKESLNSFLDVTHEDKNITRIYQALYTATPLPKEMQSIFGNLGVSHLFAISGFHLGVLSTLLFFLFKAPYSYLQQRYFPYRSYKKDSFVFLSITLLFYLLFLNVPPSLLRAYVMLVIGFVLYDRGFKIVSMWTLLLTVVLILSFLPRLFFSIGFWLSVSGVFYIFLFLLYFKKIHTLWQLVLVPIWVYIMMLPYSLFIFENFSLQHPLSIIWTSVFSLFYPLSILLHIIRLGDALDFLVLALLEMGVDKLQLTITKEIFVSFILLSLLAIYKKFFLFLALALGVLIFVYSVYNVAYFKPVYKNNPRYIYP